MMRVLEVRVNLVFIFFPLQNHYRFIVLEWSQLDVLDTHGCIRKWQPCFLEIIGFPLKIDRHENRLYKQHLEIILLNQLSLWCQKITYITNLL